MRCRDAREETRSGPHNAAMSLVRLRIKCGYRIKQSDLCVVLQSYSVTKRRGLGLNYKLRFGTVLYGQVRIALDCGQAITVPFAYARTRAGTWKTPFPQ